MFLSRDKHMAVILLLIAYRSVFISLFLPAVILIFICLFRKFTYRNCIDAYKQLSLYTYVNVYISHLFRSIFVYFVDARIVISVIIYRLCLLTCIRIYLHKLYPIQYSIIFYIMILFVVTLIKSASTQCTSLI